MLVTSSLDSIELVLGSNVTTNQLHVNAYYNRITPTSITPVKNVTTSSNTTPVNIVPAPSAGNQHQLRYCNIFNCDSGVETVIVRYNYNGTTRTVVSTSLQVNEYLQYTPKTGWKAFDINGSVKISNNNNGSDLQYPDFNYTANFTTALSIINAAYCIYLGKATSDHKFISFTQMHTVAISPSGSAFGEVGIYKGTPNLGQNVTINRCGFADMSTFWLRGQTQHGMTVPVSNVNTGDDLWAVFASSGSSAVSLRVNTIPDDIGAGFLQTTSALTRPSLTASLSPIINTTSGSVRLGWSGI